MLRIYPKYWNLCNFWKEIRRQIIWQETRDHYVAHGHHQIINNGKLPPTFLKNVGKYPTACTLIEKETPTQMFTCEFCEIFQSSFFVEHLRLIASIRSISSTCFLKLASSCEINSSILRISHLIIRDYSCSLAEYQKTSANLCFDWNLLKQPEILYFCREGYFKSQHKYMSVKELFKVNHESL